MALANMQETTTFSREELFRKVWSTPLRILCFEYGISDRGLAKLCNRMEIPLPGRGYWRRVECNWNVKKPSLPPLSTKGQSVATFHNDGKKPAQVPTLREKIKIPEELRNPHPLVKQTRSIARGMQIAKGGFFYLGNKKGLNIRCSRGTLKRALCIFDALIKTLEANEMPVLITDKGETVAICASQKIRFLLEERRTRTQNVSKYGYAHTEYSPAGHLSFRIEESLSEKFRRSWTDGKRQKLEDCLPEIIAVIKYIGPKKAEAEALWEERRRASEAAAQIRREEGERERRLHDEISEWKKVQEIREYLAALSRQTAEQSEERKFWITWIEAYAKLVDPLNPEREGQPYNLFNYRF